MYDDNGLLFLIQLCSDALKHSVTSIQLCVTCFIYKDFQ